MSIVKDHGIQVKVFSDSTTAIACISKLGTSHSELCHHITKQIWEWAEKKDIHITASIMPGHKNINADRESRELLNNLEWMRPKSLRKVLKILKFNPEADMFASHINYRFHTYFSYYEFPPFPVISRTLKKIEAEKTEGILVVPYWPNQATLPVLFNPFMTGNRNQSIDLPSKSMDWFLYDNGLRHKRVKMLIDIPILIASKKILLKLPQYPELVQLMWRKTDIVVRHLADSSQKAMEFQSKLKTYWKHRGNR